MNEFHLKKSIIKMGLDTKIAQKPVSYQLISAFLRKQHFYNTSLLLWDTNKKLSDTLDIASNNSIDSDFVVFHIPQGVKLNCGQITDYLKNCTDDVFVAFVAYGTHVHSNDKIVDDFTTTNSFFSCFYVEIANNYNYIGDAYPDEAFVTVFGKVKTEAYTIARLDARDGYIPTLHLINSVLTRKANNLNIFNIVSEITYKTFPDTVKEQEKYDLMQAQIKSGYKQSNIVDLIDEISLPSPLNALKNRFVVPLHRNWIDILGLFTNEFDYIDAFCEHILYRSDIPIYIDDFRLKGIPWYDVLTESKKNAFSDLGDTDITPGVNDLLYDKIFEIFIKPHNGTDNEMFYHNPETGASFQRTLDINQIWRELISNTRIDIILNNDLICDYFYLWQKSPLGIYFKEDIKDFIDTYPTESHFSSNIAISLPPVEAQKAFIDRYEQLDVKINSLKKCQNMQIFSMGEVL